jgi:beta-lactamase regulating signal transducer with metallopeptidase domain
MTHFSADASTAVLAQLAISAARAIVLGCAAALALSVFRVKSTRVRLLGWSAVLYAALAMPMLAWMLPSLEIPAPAFLQFASAQPAQQMDFSTPEGSVTVSDHSVETPKAKSIRLTAAASAPNRIPTSTLPSSSAPAPSPSTSWGGIAAGIYFSFALILIARFAVGLTFARRLVNVSHEIFDARVTSQLDACADAAGIASVPKILQSKLISVPVTIGAQHPAILLPENWREWDEAKLRAVIAHEVSHVARRDALTQHLSLLHRAIFWFSPLAWWLDRHLAELAEQASDEAALSCGTDRNDYARTLLGFFEALHGAPGRVWWQGVAMAKSGQAEQRLERILSWRGAVTMSLKKSIIIATFALALPVIYLAASVRPAIHPPGMRDQLSQDQAPPAPAAAPTPPPRPLPNPRPLLNPRLT